MNSLVHTVGKEHYNYNWILKSMNELLLNVKFSVLLAITVFDPVLHVWCSVQKALKRAAPVSNAAHAFLKEEKQLLGKKKGSSSNFYFDSE